MEEFKEWLQNQGCQVEVTQPDDGSGFEVWEVLYPVWHADQGSSVMSHVTMSADFGFQPGSSAS